MPKREGQCVPENEEPRETVRGGSGVRNRRLMDERTTSSLPKLPLLMTTPDTKMSRARRGKGEKKMAEKMGWWQARDCYSVR